MKVIVKSSSKNSYVDIEIRAPRAVRVASINEYMPSFNNVVRSVFIYGTMIELGDRVQVDDKTLSVRYKIGPENTKNFLYVSGQRTSKRIQTFVDASVDSFNHNLSFVKQSLVST